MAFLLTTTALAPVAAQNLHEALEQAYQTNPDLLAARAELRAVDESVSQAYSRYRPTLSVQGRSEGSTGRVDGRSVQLFTNSVGLNITQNIYEGGRTVASIDSAVNQVGQQRAVLLSVEQGILLDAVTAYTDVVRRTRRVDLAVNNEQRLARQLQATVDRFEVGEVTRTDVAQAEARLADAAAQRVSDEGELAVSIGVYEAVIGVRPGTLSSREATVASPASLVEAQARSEKNPALVAAEFSVQAALADVRVNQADLLPSLDLEGSVSYVNNPSRLITNDTEGRIGAIVTIPLYQGGAEYSRVRQSKQIVEQRRHEFDLARRDVRELVTTEWEDLVTARAALRSIEESVRANQIALEGVQTEAQVGARTVLDVLDAEQELFEAQQNEVDARAFEIVALYSLVAAMGELTAEALDLDVSLYDPRVHYDEVKTQPFGLDAGKRTTIFEDIDFQREWSQRTAAEAN
ncbi:MAG: TolC family outer membrane protein [Pseudomonadota bacterium]